MPPIARLVIWNDQRVSSRGLWGTFHVQPPSRLGKARLYLASRQPVELPIPPSTHLLRESGQIQGFVTRSGALCKRFAKARCRSVLASDQPIA